jgi:hypothetical protein
MEITTLRCIIGDTLRDRIRDKDIYEIQDITKWVRFRMDDNRLAKITKNGKSKTSRCCLDGLQNVDAKVDWTSASQEKWDNE